MTLTPTFRPRRFAVAVAMMTALTASVVGGITPFSPASEASAMIIGPSNPTWGGSSSSSMVCSAQNNNMRLSINAAVQTNFVRGQWIAYRYYLTDGHGASWSQWAQRFVHHNNYNTVPLFDYTFNNLPDGRNYNAYTEIKWWNGSSWSAARGQWASRGQAGYYFISYNGHCFT